MSLQRRVDKRLECFNKYPQYISKDKLESVNFTLGEIAALTEILDVDKLSKLIHNEMGDEDYV